MDDVMPERATGLHSPPKRSAAVMVRNAFPVLMLFALCLGFGLLSDRFLSVNNALIVMQQSAVLLVAAVAMTFVIVSGSIDLSVGSIVAVSALAAASLSASFGAFLLAARSTARCLPTARYRRSL